MNSLYFCKALINVGAPKHLVKNVLHNYEVIIKRLHNIKKIKISSQHIILSNGNKEIYDNLEIPPYYGDLIEYLDVTENVLNEVKLFEDIEKIYGKEIKKLPSHLHKIVQITIANNGNIKPVEWSIINSFRNRTKQDIEYCIDLVNTGIKISIF